MTRYHVYSDDVAHVITHADDAPQHIHEHTHDDAHDHTHTRTMRRIGGGHNHEHSHAYMSDVFTSYDALVEFD